MSLLRQFFALVFDYSQDEDNLTYILLTDNREYVKLSK
jgi:hypothetical protein